MSKQNRYDFEGWVIEPYAGWELEEIYDEIIDEVHLFKSIILWYRGWAEPSNAARITNLKNSIGRLRRLIERIHGAI